ncbi:MAG: serine/threonine protein kinase [Myxococcota bacterium]|jgi:serine/threonine protein kinase
MTPAIPWPTIRTVSDSSPPPDASSDASSDAPYDPMLGRVIGGKHRLVRRLGSGGYGSVYLGEHLATGGRAAIKLLREDALDGPAAVKRFRHEARNTHMLEHHNTARLFDVGQTKDQLLYLVMEHVSGETLLEALNQDHRFSVERTVRVITQVLKSLREAHGLRIVHRDVKPANIMLTDRFGEPDFVKVLDFGVSRLLDSSGADTGGVVGTPKCMAPEQFAVGPIGPRADLCSVGCITYQLLAGFGPFDRGIEQADNRALVFGMRHAEEPPEDLLSALPGVCSEELADVVMRLLAKDPADRFSSAEEVLAALQKSRLHDRLSAQHCPAAHRTERRPGGHTSGTRAPQPSPPDRDCRDRSGAQCLGGVARDPVTSLHLSCLHDSPRPQPDKQTCRSSELSVAKRGTASLARLML